MKKLLYIFPTLQPGGAEKVAIQIANYLTEKYAYEITFFVYDDSDYYKPFINKKIKIIQHGHRHRFSSKIFWWYCYYINFGFALITAVHSTDYDVIVSIHEQVPEAASLWLWAFNLLQGKNIQKKMVSVISTSLVGVHGDRAHLASRALFALLRKLRRYIFGSVVVLSKSVLQNIRNFHNHVFVIPNPIDFQLLEQSIQKHHFPLHKQKPYLLFVARMTAQKNPLLLLQAFARIQKVITCNLIIVGYISDKILYKKIKEFIKEQMIEHRINILDPVDNPYPYIANARGVILVSNYEGLPMVLLEAMALKVPIITTKYEGHDEYFDDTIATLVERNSVEKLSETLLQFELEYPKFNKKAEKAFQYSKKFDIKNIAEKYHKLFIGETG